ncbi:MAG: helix-turn-helix transcriptional regulator [Phycisphaeraceae bacterium]
MSQLLDAIRDSIKASGKSLNRIAIESGITAGQLSRMMRGERGLTIDVAEQLADFLGLEVVIRPKRRSKKGR